MNESRVIESAVRWRLVSFALGAAALLIILGTGTLLPPYLLVLSVALAGSMFGIIYSKLQFVENVQLRDNSRPMAEDLIAAMRSRYPDARVTKQRGRDVTIKTRQSALHDIRISTLGPDDDVLRVTSTPPARGELGMQPMRSRIHEWVEIVEILNRGFGGGAGAGETDPVRFK
jgi:hypothetical protein